MRPFLGTFSDLAQISELPSIYGGPPTYSVLTSHVVGVLKPLAQVTWPSAGLATTTNWASNNTGTMQRVRQCHGSFAIYVHSGR